MEAPEITLVGATLLAPLDIVERLKTRIESDDPSLPTNSRSFVPFASESTTSMPPIRAVMPVLAPATVRWAGTAGPSSLVRNSATPSVELLAK